MEIKDIALGAVMAGFYAALVVGLGPISFLQVQFRVANALIGIVPILGMPAVFGVTMGVFLGNLASPLGLIDLASTIPTFIGCVAVYRLRRVSVLAGLSIYTVILSTWVSFILQFTLNIPFLPTLPYLFIGIGVVTIGLGYALYRALLAMGGKDVLSRQDG